MQVSNSTGQSTDYRVGANGGGATAPEELKDTYLSGQLKPYGDDRCDPPQDARSWVVEFYIENQLVASITCFKDPGVLTLVRDDWGFWIKRGLAA